MTTTSTKPRTSSRKTTSLLLLLLASALLLPLLFPPFYCYFLAPVALVPLAWTILERPMKPRFAAAYYLFGLAFFLPNLFWLAPVTIGGYFALAFFLALYLPLFAWAFHRLVISFRMPATFALPLAWTFVEYARSTFVQGGFPWFMLGNALAPAPLLIQTADLFGVWTLTFLICMTNGFLVDFLRLPSKRGLSPQIAKLFTITAATILLALAYGLFRLHQSTTTPGPQVAVIQENLPQSLKDDPAKGEENFQKHVRLTQLAAISNPKPDLIVWPETMVPAEINPEILHLDEAFLSDAGRDLVEKSRRYDTELRTLATTLNTPLLVGAPGYVPDDSPAGGIRQNLTLLYLPTTGQSATAYSKIHLVPFGEYIPFKTVPLLGSVVRYFTPIDFDYSLTPGKEWTRFTLPVGDKTYTFCTPICFEDTMPDPARHMTNPPPLVNSPSLMSYRIDGKTDFLLNVSNDGWFYSVELNQHLEACQLRAVENRIPIARSVNTGDSGFIDSNGRIIKLVTDPNTGNSVGAIGFAAVTLPLDSRITLFTRVGDLLPIFCGVITTLFVAYTYVRPRRAR
ncbi:MAG: apolipoprotein N-acyltransferase [Phycisphaerae bacterium]